MAVSFALNVEVPIMNSATFGFTTQDWGQAKLEAVCAIIQAGRRGQTITYSELAKQIPSIAIEPHSYAMNGLLDQVSKEEDAAGRSILTALVVRKEDGVPAEGFWESARDIGRQWKNKDAMWTAEVKRALQDCQSHPLWHRCARISPAGSSSQGRLS